MPQERKAWRILFMGTPGSSIPSLRALYASPDQVIAVVTRQDRPSGRGRKISASPVKDFARKAQIPVFQPASLREDNVAQAFCDLRPDLIVVVAYGKILPPELLAVPTRGSVNLHFSLLPAYRGAAPVEWAILRGEEQTGVTTILMDEGMDTGDILLQKTVSIADRETTGELRHRLSEVGALLLVETIEGLKNGEVTPVPQLDHLASYSKLIKKAEGFISWSLSAVEIERMVRAFNPWPTARTRLRGKVLKIHRARAVSSMDGLSPQIPVGSLIEVNRKEAIVLTGKGGLSLEVVQLENRKSLEIPEFLNGFKIERGDRFE